jgi:hypothetical protein
LIFQALKACGFFSLKAQSSGNGPSHGESISEFLTKLATGDDYGQRVAPVVQASVVTPYAAPIFPPPVEQDQAWYVIVPDGFKEILKM